MTAARRRKIPVVITEQPQHFAHLHLATIGNQVVMAEVMPVVCCQQQAMIVGTALPTLTGRGRIRSTARYGRRGAEIQRRRASVAAFDPRFRGADTHLANRDVDEFVIIDYNEITQTGDTLVAMSSITIRNLDPALKERLRVRAAQHGQSMEAEARRILQTALSAAGLPAARNLYDRIHGRFARLGGVELELPPREAAREPPRFE